MTGHFPLDYIFRQPDSSAVIISKQNMALRRHTECGFVSLFGLVLPAWISVLRLCRSLEEEVILSRCVRVNHELFTE